MNSFLDVSLDRPSHRYWVGEKAVFRFIMQQDAVVDAVFTIGGQTVLLHQSIALKAGEPKTVELGLSAPGFLRCEALPQGTSPVRGMIRLSAAFEPENLTPQLPKRDDFETFWENSLAELHSIPADFQMVQDQKMSFPGFSFYRVSAANVDGSRIFGWLSVPQAAFGPVPLVVTTAGYGPGFSASSMWARREFLGIWKDSVSVLCLGIHDFEAPDNPAELKQKFESVMSEYGNSHYYMRGIQDPAHCYLRRAILGCVRLTELVAEQKFVDKESIVWAGSGQGGDFGIYVSALTRKITAAFIGTPGFCDIGPEKGSRHTTLGASQDFRKNIEEQRLFDCVWHASHVNNPVLLSVDYTDTVSYPTAVFPLLRTLRGERLVLELVSGGLGFGNKSSMHTVRAWLRCKLKLI